MKRNRITVSMIAASILFSVPMSAEIVIDDTNTSTISLPQDENLTITQNGKIKISDSNAPEDINITQGDGNNIIRNFGDIEANLSNTQNAIKAQSISVHDSLVENNGTIFLQVTSDNNSTSSRGISGKNSNITNSGTISLENNAGEDINSLGISGEDSNITNSGTISLENNAGGDIGSAGIFGKDSNITNSGTISLKNSSSESILSIGISGEDSNITNSGTISLKNSSSEFIVSIGMDGIGPNITNSGTISLENNAGGDINSLGISGKDSNITNSGTISLENNAGGDIASAGIFGSNSNIANSGTIKVVATGDINSTTIGIGYRSTSNIENNGQITADFGIASIADGASFVLDSIPSDSVTVTITNNGIITSYGILAPNADMTNSGKLNLLYDQERANSSYIYYNHINKIKLKSYHQTNQGQLSIAGLLQEDGRIAHGQLLAESVTINDGSKINLNIINSNDITAQINLLGHHYSVKDIIAANTLDLNVSTLKISDNLALVDFKAVQNDNNLSLEPVSGGANTSLPAEFSPLATLSSTILSPRIVNTFSMLIEQRQSFFAGMGSGDELFSDRYIWFKPFTTYTDQKDKNGKYGFDARTNGFGIGMDGDRDGKVYGFALFYANSNVDTNHIDQSSEIDSFQIVLYGSAPIIDDRSNLSYQIGYGWQFTDTQRLDTGSGQYAVADYTSKSFFAQLKANRRYTFGEKLSLLPTLKTVYRHFTNPSYSETGAGSTSLSVNSFSTSQFLLGGGADLNYKPDDSLLLSASLYYLHDLRNEAPTVVVYFQGAPDYAFNTQGIKNSSNNYEFSLGITKSIQNQLSLQFEYDINGRGSDLKNHSLIANARWRF